MSNWEQAKRNISKSYRNGYTENGICIDYIRNEFEKAEDDGYKGDFSDYLDDCENYRITEIIEEEEKQIRLQKKYEKSLLNK